MPTFVSRIRVGQGIQADGSEILRFMRNIDFAFGELLWILREAAVTI